MKINYRVPITLAIGVVAMSSAAIMIRFAQQAGAPSSVIAFFRLGTATLVLTPLMFQHNRFNELSDLGPQAMGIVLVSGILLALHFAAWIVSLEFTSVMSSVVLVSTTPIWIGLASPLILQEKLPIATWIAIVMALVGSILLSSSSNADNVGIFVPGNGLALAGAIFVAGYLLIGRRVRDGLSLISYLWLVYGAAAMTLLLLVAVSGQTVVGYSISAYVLMIALGLIPQLFGHSVANYALRYMPAVIVSIAMLGEPIGASLIAMITFGEVPQPIELLGGLLIIIGIALAAIVQDDRERSKSSDE